MIQQGHRILEIKLHVNSSTEVPLVSHSTLVKKGVYHFPVVIFTKKSMDAYKHIPVFNIFPFRFVLVLVEENLVDFLN